MTVNKGGKGRQGGKRVTSIDDRKWNRGKRGEALRCECEKKLAGKAGSPARVRGGKGGEEGGLTQARFRLKGRRGVRKRYRRRRR